MIYESYCLPQRGTTVSPLSLPTADRIAELADIATPLVTAGSRVVAVSGAMYVNIYVAPGGAPGADAARLQAAQATAVDSRLAGVPHLFMLDSDSHADAHEALAEEGGIVLPIDHATEGGLARPYLIGALVIDELVRRGILPESVLMVKAEGEKNLFGGSDTLEHYLQCCTGFDVATGMRTNETWDTMPAFLGLTESVLAYCIEQLLDTTADAPSGILVLGSKGRKLFLDTTTANDWTYLIRTPVDADYHGFRRSDFPITFDYHPSVVAEENGNSKLDDKRRAQFALMLDFAVDLTKEQGLRSDEEIALLTDRFRKSIKGIRSAA